MLYRIFVSLLIIITIISISITGFLFYLLYAENTLPAAETVSDMQNHTDTESDSADSFNTEQDTGDIKNSFGESKNGEDKVNINTENTPVKETLKIVAVGDINLGRGVKAWVEKQEKRYIYPFEEVVDILKRNDVIFGNLEEPITASTKGLAGIDEGGKYVLKNDPEAINGIIYAGFNLLSLANNHILDYYEKGLLDTMEILDRNNIAYAGAGKNLEEARNPAVLEKKGQKIGMLAYTDMAEVVYKGDPPLMFLAGEETCGVAPTRKEYILEDIKKYRNSFDILIVSMHWGVEYSYEPTESQVALAHEIIDRGADIIIGHHTHRCQGVEIYKGKPIFYSLGNFLFDQNNPLNQESFIFEMEMEDKKLTALSGIPFKVINKSRIVPAKGAEAKEMLEREKILSEKLNSVCRIEDDKIIFDIE